MGHDLRGLEARAGQAEDLLRRPSRAPRGRSPARRPAPGTRACRAASPAGSAAPGPRSGRGARGRRGLPARAQVPRHLPRARRACSPRRWRRSGRPKPAKPRRSSNARIDRAMSRKSRTRNISFARRVELPGQHREVVRPHVLLGEVDRRGLDLGAGERHVPVVDRSLAERGQPLDVGRARTTCSSRRLLVDAVVVVRVVADPPEVVVEGVRDGPTASRFAGSDSTRSMCSQYFAGADS